MAKPKPIIHMVVPGRRALGEGWRKVTVYPRPDGSLRVENEATETPAVERPILVPAFGEMSIEQADYIIGWLQKENEYRKVHGLQPPKPDAATVNQIWQDYCEWKQRAWRGQTTIGRGGMAQRESVDELQRHHSTRGKQ